MALQSRPTARQAPCAKQRSAAKRPAWATVLLCAGGVAWVREVDDERLSFGQPPGFAHSPGAPQDENLRSCRARSRLDKRERPMLVSQFGSERVFFRTSSLPRSGNNACVIKRCHSSSIGRAPDL